MRILAERSKTVDKMVIEAKKTSREGENIFYDKPELKNHLQGSIVKMEKMMQSNRDLGTAFGNFEADIEKVKKLDTLNAKFTQVEDVVVSLDNLLQISEYEAILKELTGVVNRFGKDKLEIMANKVVLSDQRDD